MGFSPPPEAKRGCRNITDALRWDWGILEERLNIMNFLSFLFYPHIILPAAPPTLTTKHSFVCYHLYIHGTTQEIKGGFVKKIKKQKPKSGLECTLTNSISAVTTALFWEEKLSSTFFLESKKARWVRAVCVHESESDTKCSSSQQVV